MTPNDRYSSKIPPAYSDVMPIPPSEPVPAVRVSATRDGSKLHLAVNHIYTGSVDIATGWWMGRKVTLIVNHQSYAVTRGSCEQHLKIFGMDLASPLHYGKVMAKAEVRDTSERIWRKLSTGKQRDLLHAFQEAIETQNFAHAITLVEQGVPMSNYYVVSNGTHSYIFSTYSFALDRINWFVKDRYKDQILHIVRQSPLTILLDQKQAVQVNEPAQQLFDLLTTKYRASDTEQDTKFTYSWTYGSYTSGRLTKHETISTKYALE
jgi:hypothetical protein